MVISLDEINLLEHLPVPRSAKVLNTSFQDIKDVKMDILL